MDPLADHENQVDKSPYAYAWNNPILLFDPDGLCPDCPDPSTAKEGDVSNPNGSRSYTLTNGEWIGDGGSLPEVTVTGYNTSDGEAPRYGSYMGISGQLNAPKSAGAAFSDAMQDLLTTASTTLVPTGAVASMGMKGLSMLRFANATKGGVQYTKSSLKLGQEMHNAYKVGANGIKEFRLPSGKRIDFLDVNNGIIHELKPFNPRAMKAGQKQLDMYLKEIQSPATLMKHPELRGINWKTILDTY